MSYNPPKEDFIDDFDDIMGNHAEDSEATCSSDNFDEPPAASEEMIIPVVRKNSRSKRNTFVASEDGEIKKVQDCVQKLLRKWKFAYLGVSPSSERFSTFEQGVWIPCSDDMIVNYCYGLLSSAEINEIDTGLKRFLSATVYQLKLEVYKLQLSGLYKFTEKDFDRIKNRAVFNNVVVDAKTGETFKHDPTLPYYIKIDADYIDEDQEAEHHEKLLLDATGHDQDSVEMIKAYEGYLCIPNQSAKAFGYMGLARDSGKSLLGKLITETIGNSITTDFGQISGRFALSRFGNANLVTCFEFSTSELKREQIANIKRFTGEKRLRCEVKYENEREITVLFKLLLAGNGALRLEQQDMAFYRRLLILPFVNSTPSDKCDPSLEQKLKKEKDIIFSSAVRCIGKYIKDNGSVHIPVSELSKNMWDTWSGSKCVEKSFADCFLTFTGSYDDVIPVDYLYEEYLNYFYKKGGDDTAIVSSKKKFTDEISNIFTGSQVARRRKGPQLPNGNKQPVKCLIGLKYKGGEINE